MSDEEILNNLYVRRQELFKQLTEVDSNIKNLEAQIELKRGNSKAIAVDESLTSVDDSNKVAQLILRSMADPVGLREALKAVDTCRMIQESEADYTGSKARFRNAVVQETINHAVALSQSPPGSDLIIKVVALLKSGTVPAVLSVDSSPPADPAVQPSEHLLLIERIGDKMPALCCDTNGARVVQKIVESFVTEEELNAFVKAIEPSIVELAKDINGNHSLAKLMVKTSSKSDRDADSSPSRVACDEAHKIIYTRLSENCIDICKNRQGCCIIQKCIQLAPDPYKEMFIKLVLSSALRLVQDPFGNYVVQHILDKEEEGPRRGAEGREAGEYTNQIIRQMLHHVAELSCNKFSSNVIEKCLKTASADVRQLMVDELTEPQVLPKLLTDSFANYVIQTAISTSNDVQLNQLRDAITPLQGLLKNSPYGVKIDAKLARRHRETVRKQSKKGRDTSNAGMMNHNQRQDVNVMGNPQFIPGMGFPIVAAENPAMMQRMFTNIPPEMSLYSSSVPLMLSPQPVLHFNQSVSSNPQSQPPPSLQLSTCYPETRWGRSTRVDDFWGLKVKIIGEKKALTATMRWAKHYVFPGEEEKKCCG
eukprot:gene4901-3513_t